MSRSERLARLLAEASALDREARRAYLDQLRATEPEDADEIASLLAASDGEPGLLDGSAWSAFDLPLPGREEAVPEVVGPYRLVRLIGRGGMGRVFLAEQLDEGFTRQVALKVIDRRDLSGETVRRFRDEVRILAGLEHPGIARFLDGRRTDDGLWYLALEYVDGDDLLSHVRDRDLPTGERIRLFLSVLETVEFAHARGVVHRDLKPGNILVDRAGRTRLLDFGIAKLVDAQTQDAAVTRTELRALTPAYASPEQFRGERATARSDVYSLGVVLYELLSGGRPHGDDSSSSADLERAVLEVEPDPPSTAARRLRRLRTSSPEARASTASASQLGRDLDAICLKALRKEPDKRYPSAAAFADDLARFLEGRPVQAREGGFRYRSARFAKRHRGRIAIAAALAVAVAAILLAVDARRGAGTGVTVSEPPPRPFPYSAVNAPPIEELERRFDESPASVPAGAELALALSRAGRADEAVLIVARLRQVPGEELDPLIDYVDGNLAMGRDERQRALVLLTRALENAIGEGRGELVAQIRATRGRLLSIFGRSAEASAEMESARRAFEAAGDSASLARVLNDLGIEAAEAGDLDRAERLLEEALVATRAVSPDNRGTTFLLNLAGLAFERGRPDLAEPRLRECVRTFRELDRPHRLGLALGNLAEVLGDLGRPDEARGAQEEAIKLLRAEGDDTELSYRLYNRAAAAIAAARLEEAVRDADEIEAAANSSGSELGLGLAKALAGEIALVRGDRDAARRLLGEARPLLRGGDADQSARAIELLLARAELSGGEHETARELAELSIAPLRRYRASATLFLGEILLARIDLADGDAEAAARRLAGLPPGLESSPSVRLRLASLAAKADLARSRGDLASARRDLETAIEIAATAAHRIDELDLRLDLARLGIAVGASTPEIAEIAAEAERLELFELAARARRRQALLH